MDMHGCDAVADQQLCRDPDHGADPGRQRPQHPSTHLAPPRLIIVLRIPAASAPSRVSPPLHHAAATVVPESSASRASYHGLSPQPLLANAESVKRRGHDQRAKLQPDGASAEKE
ncbi:hypothetical protein K3495_g902 [Podosphaera aphanis]|nr:hypothetical protein K3495_g902 [Podosphaera aphanis]